MHEVVCAAAQLSETAIQERFSGLRGLVSALADGKLEEGNAATGSSSSSSSSSTASDASVLCRHLALFTLRPDVHCTEVVAAVAEVAEVLSTFPF